MSFFKKAMGIFVEFEDDSKKNETESSSSDSNSQLPRNTVSTPASLPAGLNQEDMDKFERHFDKLFDGANLPGPDYYEFWKTMETLEQHIPDEKARISATYASLSIQGLTKAKLVETAMHYRKLVEQDKQAFEKAFSAKAGSEIVSREHSIKEMEKKIASNSEMIQRLTKEISDAQVRITTLKKEIIDQEAKLSSNRQGYEIACQAMIRKISGDIDKINSLLQ